MHFYKHCHVFNSLKCLDPNWRTNTNNVLFGLIRYFKPLINIHDQIDICRFIVCLSVFLNICKLCESYLQPCVPNLICEPLSQLIISVTTEDHCLINNFFCQFFFFLHCYICVSDWNSSKPLELVNNFIHEQDLLTVAPWVSNWVSESFGHNRDLVLSRSVNQLSQWVQWVMFRLIWLAELCKPWNWTNCWTNLNELFNWMDWNDSSHWKDKKKKKLC